MIFFSSPGIASSFSGGALGYEGNLVMVSTQVTSRFIIRFYLFCSNKMCLKRKCRERFYLLQ